MKNLMTLFTFLTLSSPAFASEKYLYLVATEGTNHARVFSVAMDSIYPHLLNKVEDRGDAILECVYKTAQGDSARYTIEWNSCDSRTDMGLELSVGGANSGHSVPFTGHNAIEVDGSLEAQDRTLYINILSATKYVNFRRHSFDGPLPLVGAVPPVKVTERYVDDREMAPGTLECGLTYGQRQCQQPRD